MKILFALLGLLLYPVLVLAAFVPTQWQYYKDITGLQPGLVSVPLDDDVLVATQRNLADLRVVTPAGTETPYILRSGEPRSSRETLYPRLLNNVFVAGESSSAVLDFAEVPRGATRLAIETAAQNFQRRVTIYGGNDINNWRVLKDDGYIYDFTDTVARVNARNTTLSLPESTFRYLKVVVDDTEFAPVRISGVAAYHDVAASAREVSRRPKFTTAINDEYDNSDIIIDLEQPGLPHTKAVLTIAEDNFSRGVSVYAGNDLAEWRYLGSDYIFRYRTARYSADNTSVSFPEADSRYLKVSIINNDDQPLTVSDVSVVSVYREVVFEAVADTGYALYYGNPGAAAPRYDFEKYFRYLDIDSARAATLSLQRENAQYVPVRAPLTERVPYLLPVVLVILSVGLLFAVYRFFKGN